MAKISLRPMGEENWSAVAELIHTSTNGWYEAHGHAPAFACGPTDLEVFCRVYETLDPGCCILAVDEDSERILGSCFYHPRPTHFALGIMNAHPDAFGRGIARRLLSFVTDLAAQENKPVRLVSSTMNLDSFSLYNRAGFTPFAIYQDMNLEVPAAGLRNRPQGHKRARDATTEDIKAMVHLESELVGIDRRKDFEYFIANADGIWHSSVLEGDDGVLSGFLVSVADPGCNMLGPGVMRSVSDTLVLLARELDHHRGRSPTFLLPADQPDLTAAVYAWGGRNCEMHFGQVLGRAMRPRGVVMPTFLPESG